MSDRIEQLRKLHDADPEDTFCTYGIAMEYVKLDQPEPAIEWFDKTIDLDSHYHYAYYQKARMLHQLGKTDQARQTLNTAIEIAQADNDQKALSELQQLLANMV